MAPCETVRTEVRSARFRVVSGAKRLAVLVSGTGTILDALIEAQVPVAVVIADRACPALDRAGSAGLATELVERTEFGPGFDRAAYTERLVDRLRAHAVDLIAMGGFGTVLGPAIHTAFPHRVVNTHPSLLPAFKGWHAVEDALARGVKVTGCTVHLAELDVDEGPILAQEAVAVLPDDSVESLHERIKVVERRVYPEVLRQLLEEHP